ncbi:MAG: hypothetical protein DWQ02_19270 [Bacteroidetes bacterium]|nr:MAG: hypothetical protein DWQ02_19270 [Bacteroidota bacterium]
MKYTLLKFGIALGFIFCFGVVNGQFVEMATEPMEGYEYLPYFPEKLMKQQPSAVLPHSTLSKPFAWTTQRPDTIEIFKKVIIGEMDSTQMYCFVQNDHPAADLLIAVKNQDHWVILKTIIFRHLTYDATQFRVVQLGRQKVPHLEVIVFREKNVLGQYGRQVSSQWKRSKTISLINLNTLQRPLANIYTGYEYIYTIRRYENDVRYSKIQSANLWYDFKINYKKGKIKVKQLDNRLDALEQTGEETPVLINSEEEKNAPLLRVGMFKFDGERFVFRK